MKKKSALIIAGCILALVTCFSQPIIEGQKTIGSGNGDYFRCMDLTSDGGLVAGGEYNNNYGVNLIKVDSMGKKQWAYNLRFLRNIKAVHQTDDLGYIIGGYFTYDDIYFKGYVEKFDSSMNLQWHKTFDRCNNMFAQVTSLQQCRDRGYILIVFSYCSPEVIRLDSAGNILWDKYFNYSDYGASNCIQQTSDGGYMLGGTQISNIHMGSWDYWLAKLDSTGNMLSEYLIGGDEYDELHTFNQTIDHGYILGGISFSNISGDKTENSRGGYDYWIVKIDSLGSVLWDKTIGGNSDEYLTDLQQTIDEGVIVGGYSNSDISNEKTENSRGSDDYWVAKLTENGKIQWDKTIGGDTTDLLYGIKEVKKNHYVLGGSSSSGISGDKTDTSRGYSDCWLVYLNFNNPNNINKPEFENNNSVIKRESIQNSDLAVYPNPAKDIMHVQLDDKGIISLIDQSGKILLTKHIDGNGVINITGLATGIYFLKNNNTGEVQKVVVTK